MPPCRLPSFVALLLSILSELNAELYDDYMNYFATRTDRIDFLTEILMLFNDMIEKTVFSSDWFQMICKRNRYVVKLSLSLPVLWRGLDEVFDFQCHVENLAIHYVHDQETFPARFRVTGKTRRKLRE